MSLRPRLLLPVLFALFCLCFFFVCILFLMLFFFVDGLFFLVIRHPLRKSRGAIICDQFGGDGQRLTRQGHDHLLTVWKNFSTAGYMEPSRYPVALYRPRDRPSLGPRWVRGPAYPGHPSGRWDDPPEPTAPRSYVTRATPVSRALHAPQPTVYRVWNGHSTFNAPSCC